MATDGMHAVDLNSSVAECVFVYDRRSGGKPEVKVSTTGVSSYKEFRTRVAEILGLDDKEKYVLTATNREEIHNDETWQDLVENGDTLYVLSSVEQELPAAAQERVNFLPHYDTIVKGGMYEYYASEGQNPLPYAFAELIDNALAATADNHGAKNIEIRLYLDDVQPNRNMVVVLDNGKGMSSHQLNNWAVYRLSKFNRREQKNKTPVISDEEPTLASQFPMLQAAPRSLNSDISYFGVGGKQAIFFIGNSTRMISRPRGSKDVHELSISKEEFERKEKNNESIYAGYIRNRKAGDASHISPDEEVLMSLIEEEKNMDSFTAVIINGVNSDHVPYLKNRLSEWTRQLAHIYHYYIHGPNGNIDRTGSPRPVSPFRNIDIQVKMCIRPYSKQDVPKFINLRDINDDMQTLYIRSTANTFEFKAVIEGTGIVEGVLRYHPFLYDRETYPSDANDPRVEPDPEDDHDYAASDSRPARGRRPIFECYWNGRLIPYTYIEEFDWCALPKKSKVVPPECFNRISGVLWTNDKFQVSTNKLTFIDLEMRLRDKNTAYTMIKGKNEKRTAIEKEFITWLRDCHGKCDKQVRFGHFEGAVVRHELPKNRQSPWASYGEIEWDGKVFKKGQLVRITKIVPILYGSVNRFLLYGEHDGDVFATGGDIEVTQEPKTLYDEIKTIPLSKLDRTTSQTQIKKYIDDEEAKLPDRLVVQWPEGDAVAHGDKVPAGKTVGAIKIEISNRRGELISKLPGSSQKKLLVELRIVWHSPNGDETIVSHISQHGKTWPYWFRKMENLKNLGPHTLQLQAVLNESGANTYAGKTLPIHRINFTITEAEPERFTVGLLDGPFRIGAPFQIPLEFQDEFGHATKPSSSLKPELEASGLELSYGDTQVQGNNLIIKNIVALGSVPSNAGKNFSLHVKVPGLAGDQHILKIRMLPGPPSTLLVTPEAEELTVENGSPAEFNVEIQDQAGNQTTRPKLNVTAKFSGAPGLPTYSLDCSQNGSGTLTGPALSLKNMQGEQQKLTVKIDVPSVKDIARIEKTIKIVPSQRAANLMVFYSSDEKTVEMKCGQEITSTAGDTISGITFKIMDEAGREKEINEDFANKLKVNWTPKISREEVKDGQLPEVKVPNLVTESKYCHISITDGSGVEFDFTVKANAAEPGQLKCRCSGSTEVRMGETLQSDIQINVKDKYGNEIKKLEKGVLKDLAVTGDGLVEKETVRMLGQSSGFNVHGIRFESGSLGSRELCVAWRGLTDYIRLKVVPGPPARLTMTDWDVSQPVTVYNENALPLPIITQLCDEAGNPTAASQIRIQLARDSGIKLTPAPLPIKTNAKGTANFGIFTVSGKQGVYELQPKAFLGRTTLSGPKIKVSIQPDATKPVNVAVEYDKSATYTVGESLPDFTVKVMGEDENIMATAKSSCLCMKLWKAEGFQATPPSGALSFHPDTKRKNDKDGIFFFSNQKVPRVSGTHNIMFVYADSKQEVFSNQIAINVQPGPPAKLVPVQSPGTPTVSNTKNTNSRCLIRSLKLQLQDSFGNFAGYDVHGKLVVEISHDTSVNTNEVPQFIGNTRKLEFQLSKGVAVLQNLMIMENTGGKDGQEYILRCTIISQAIPKNMTIPAYTIPFLFYNDAKKQSQMAALTKERDSLRAAIKTYKSLFDTTKQLINELKMSLQEAQREENKLKAELRRQGIPASQLSSVSNVDALIEARIQERQRLATAPRRMCGLQPAPKDPDVLGKIAHLAEVSDSDIARVLSWHMSADMDCVVTLTTKKAKQIYSQSNGKQQVLPLDSIFRKTLPDWGKPLPHQRIRPNWNPPGNPVYARNLLVFPHDENNCKVVFGMLLGDTIILDTLDHANTYRQEIVKQTHCPTILTRTGDRIRSNGKFGGLMNKALPIEKLKGAVFGEPLSPKYGEINTLTESLRSYRSAIRKRESANTELDEQISMQNTPEMKAKQRECQESQEQLADIEERLGVTASGAPAGAKGRGRPSSALEDIEPSPKRARGTPVQQLALNGTPSTPTRASLRRSVAGSTPAESSEDSGRKRPRRT